MASRIVVDKAQQNRKRPTDTHYSASMQLDASICASTNVKRLYLVGNCFKFDCHKVTHLVTTEDEIKANSYKVSTADKHGAIFVTEAWLLQSAAAKTRLDESNFILSKTPVPSPKPYLSITDSFVSEAELQELKEKEEIERQQRLNNPGTTSSTSSQATAPVPAPSSFSILSTPPPPNSTPGFGFGGGSGSGFGISGSNQSSSSDSQIATPSTSSIILPTTVTSPNVSTIGAPRQRSKPWPQSQPRDFVKVKAWDDTSPSRPFFPIEFEIEYFDTLQWTDVEKNHNKYYCIELHIGKDDRGVTYFRLYTHYGRTDDLTVKPQSGRRESRFYKTMYDAENAYATLMEEKTGIKGYRKVELVNSNIGSAKLKVLISEIAKAKDSKLVVTKIPGTDTIVDNRPVTGDIADIVSYIYDEAAFALNNTLGKTMITSAGIETPLGVVGMAQIEKGETILQKLYEMFKVGNHDESTIKDLTNQFYTIIPHKLGRNRDQVNLSKIATMSAFEEKQELLQLMRDMLSVTAEGKSMGTVSDLDMKYRALRAKLEVITPENNKDKFEEVRKVVLANQADSELIDIKRVFSIFRPAERTAFEKNRIQANQNILFHGSRISNFVGLLSRGLLMPKLVVAMGGKRRDAGLLGHGIYFGDSSSTSAQYCTPGSKGTRLMLLNNVALGQVKDYEQVVFGLMEPPQGYNSVHGVRASAERRTDFKDNEYVIFNPAQQYQQYLVEFTLKKDLQEFATSQLFHDASGATTVLDKHGKAITVPNSSSSSSSTDSSNGADSVTATVEQIFANLGSSNATSKPATQTKLGASLNKGTTVKSTFGSHFGSLLNTSTTPALKLQPSGLQTSTLSTSTSFGAPLKLQPSGLQPSGLQTGTSLGESLKLQPSGLQTSVKLAPLTTSFGRKSSGTATGTSNDLSALNNLQLTPIEHSIETKEATGAAAILATPTATEAMTDEEKEMKRQAMRMGGKNWGSKFASPSISSIEGDSTEYVSSKNDSKTSVTESAGDEKTSSESRNSLSKSKKRLISAAINEDIVNDTDSSIPHKKKKLLSGGIQPLPNLTYPQVDSTSSTSSQPLNWTAKYLGSSFNSSTTSTATASATQAQLPTLGASFVTSNALATSLAASSSSYSTQSKTRQFPEVRTQTSHTSITKLSALVGKEIGKERISEAKLRGMFLTDRNNVILKPNSLLVDIYKNGNILRYTIETSDERRIPKLLSRYRPPPPIVNPKASSKSSQLDPTTQGAPCVVDLAQFKINFALFTSNIFAGLNTQNMVFFGGSVLAALTLDPDNSHYGKGSGRIFSSYRDTDIEIALFGLPNDAAYNKKIQDIFFAVQSSTKATCEIIRTSDSILILGQYPVRHIRIPLKSFRGPAEVVMNVEVDCCAVAYDGNTILALPRAVRAMTKRYNLADLSLRNPGFEINLYKYAKRGYAVAVPGLQSHLVTPHLYSQQPWQVRGLAKLLLFEAEMNQKPFQATPANAPFTLEPWFPVAQCFSVYSKDEFNENRIHMYQATLKDLNPKVSDDIDQVVDQSCTTLFLPWGPQWRISRIIKQLQFSNDAYSKVAQAHLKASENGNTNSIVLIGNSAVLGLSPSASTTAAPENNSISSEKFVELVASRLCSKQPVWKSGFAEANHGFFTPLDEPSWYSEAYTLEDTIPEMIHTIGSYAFGKQTSQLVALMRKLPRTFNPNNPVTFGRLPLVYTCLRGDSESISTLIGKGALTSTMDPSSGMYPIHFAVCSGDATAVETVLRSPNTDINIKSRDQKWTALHFAAYFGHENALQVLLHDTKIRLNPRDKGGRSPVWLAAYSGHLKCLELFKGAGAKMDTKAPNNDDPNAVNAVQIAAERGHDKCRTFFIQILKLDFAPGVNQSAIEPDIVVPPSDTASQSEERQATDEEIRIWSAVDKAGQTLLHYAVRYGEEALVRQISSKFFDPSKRQPIEVPMPKEIQHLQLIDLNAENMLGQTAFYYALHLLNQFNTPTDVTDVSKLGFITPKLHKSLHVIVQVLFDAGANPPPLPAVHSIPTEVDESMLSSMKTLSAKAKYVVHKALEEAAKKEKEFQEDETNRAQNQHRTPIRRNVSNEYPGSSKSSSPGTPLSRSGRPKLGVSRYSGFVGGQAGPGFAFSPQTKVPSSIAELANTDDTTQLLVTIGQMYQAKQINLRTKNELKSLALKQDKRLMAALKAFQTDRVSLVFGHTLQLIAKVNLSGQ